MSKHPFLSDEWFAAVEGITGEEGAETGVVTDIVINVTVTSTPFGADRLMHLDSESGRGHWGIGHADGADVHLTTDYETARQVFVAGDPAQVLEALLSGRMMVQGDMAKLMTSMGAALTGNTPLHEAIQAVTA